eukprot:3013154-Pleurochrysis_carterae.AAC.3
MHTYLRTFCAGTACTVLAVQKGGRERERWEGARDICSMTSRAIRRTWRCPFLRRTSACSAGCSRRTCSLQVRPPRADTRTARTRARTRTHTRTLSQARSATRSRR